MCSSCVVCQKTWLTYPNTLLLLLSWRPYYLALPLKPGCWPQSTQVKSEIQRFASVLTAGQIPPKLGRLQHRVLFTACALSPAPPAPSKAHAVLGSLQSAHYVYFILARACKVAKERCRRKPVSTFVFLTCLIRSSEIDIFRSYLYQWHSFFILLFFFLHILNHLWNSPVAFICSSISCLKSEKIVIKIQLLPFKLWGEKWRFFNFSAFPKSRCSWFETWKIYELKNTSDFMCD